MYMYPIINVRAVRYTAVLSFILRQSQCCQKKNLQTIQINFYRRQVNHILLFSLGHCSAFDLARRMSQILHVGVPGSFHRGTGVFIAFENKTICLCFHSAFKKESII